VGSKSGNGLRCKKALGSSEDEGGNTNKMVELATTQKLAIAHLQAW
jgi:hypothetical protein